MKLSLKLTKQNGGRIWRMYSIIIQIIKYSKSFKDLLDKMGGELTPI